MTHDDGKRPDQRDDPELMRLLARLELERAPASLTRRLKRIPGEERRRERRQERGRPRWVLAPALAAIPLLVLVAVLLQQQRPSAADIEQAREDLALAFSYMDRAALRAHSEIQTVLGDELRHSVKDSLSEHLLFGDQSQQEESI